MRAGFLSGGEQQMLTICRTLIGNPELRQRAPLLEHCRKQALYRRPGGPATGACIWARSTTASMGLGRGSWRPSTRRANGPRQLALFPAERRVPDHAAGFGVQVRLNAMELHRPRQWGACWLACHLYEQLELDRFWSRGCPTCAREPAMVNHRDSIQFTRILRRAFSEHKSRGGAYGVSPRENYTLVRASNFDSCPPDVIPRPTSFAHLPFAHLTSPGFGYATLLVEPPPLRPAFEERSDFAVRNPKNRWPFQFVPVIALAICERLP